MSFNKITVDRKILAGVIFCSIILLSIAFFSFNNSEKFKETSQWVNHTHEVLYEFEQVLVYCVDAETGERGYIITGNEKYLAPFNDASSQLFEHLDKVNELTKDNPRQQKNIHRINLLAAQLTHRLSTLVDARRTAGFEKAREMEDSNISKNILDKIRKEINDAKEIENILLAQRKQSSEEDARNFYLVSILPPLVF